MRPTAIPRLGVPGRHVPELAGVCTYAEFSIRAWVSKRMSPC